MAIPARLRQPERHQRQLQRPDGALTLSDSASLANYQAALDSIAYSSSSTDPNGGADPNRVVNAAFTINSVTSTSDMPSGAGSTWNFLAKRVRGGDQLLET
jgi:hypothetical protein